MSLRCRSLEAAALCAEMHWEKRLMSTIGQTLTLKVDVVPASEDSPLRSLQAMRSSRGVLFA